MNCEEFRNAYAAARPRVPAELEAHRRWCRACADFATHEDQLDRQLVQALNVEVPEGLADRILQRNVNARVRRLGTWHFAAAAALVALVSAGLMIGSWTDRREFRNDIVTALNEQPLPRVQDALLADAEVAELLRGVGVSYRSGLVSVRLARRCQVRGTEAVYLVVQANGTDASVLVMPELSVDDRVEISGDGWQGAIVRCPKGSMAITGLSDQAVASVEANMRAATNML